MTAYWVMPSSLATAAVVIPNSRTAHQYAKASCMRTLGLLAGDHGIGVQD
jgi:hypothetical protein